MPSVFVFVGKAISKTSPIRFSPLLQHGSGAGIIVKIGLTDNPFLRLWLKATGYGACKSILKDAPTNQFYGKMGFEAHLLRQIGTPAPFTGLPKCE